METSSCARETKYRFRTVSRLPPTDTGLLNPNTHSELSMFATKAAFRSSFDMQWKILPSDIRRPCFTHPYGRPCDLPIRVVRLYTGYTFGSPSVPGGFGHLSAISHARARISLSHRKLTCRADPLQALFMWRLPELLLILESVDLFSFGLRGSDRGP